MKSIMSRLLAHLAPLLVLEPQTLSPVVQSTDCISKDQGLNFIVNERFFFDALEALNVSERTVYLREPVNRLT